MPAKCGSQGPMICLSGSTCNETLGICLGCPGGFMNDQVLYKGNENCGLNVTALIVVYVVAGVFGCIVALAALCASRARKRSRMKQMLWLIATWNLLIPVYVIVHWVEGYQHGVATCIIFLSCLMLVNTQVFTLTYTIESFLGLVTNNGIAQDIFKLHAMWYAFWMSTKIICGTVMIAGAAVKADRIFNGSMFALTITLVIEVVANIFRAFWTDRKLIRSVNELHSEIRTNKINPAVLEFAKRVERQHYIAPVYGVVMFSIALVLIALYLVYDSAIPYAYVIWSMMVITWPVLGLGPLILLKTRLGKQIEKGQSKTGTTAQVDLTLTPGRNSSAAHQSPFANGQKKTVAEDSLIGSNPA